MIDGPTARRVTPFSDPRARFLAGHFGMRLFLLSLAILFAASLVGFLVIRVLTADEWPRDFPPLPRILWLSTGVLIASSVTCQWAVAGARRDRQTAVRVGMLVTTLLGFVFLALQVVAGTSWLGVVSDRWAESETFRFALASFYVLTGLHALHVVGGLVPMTIVTVRAFRGRYGPERHAGVTYCALYWHFLDVVWIVLLLSIALGT